MEDSQCTIAEVVLPLPLKKVLHYSIPLYLQGKTETGCCVLVPLGNRKLTGYVVGIRAASSLKNLRSIEQVLDPSPLFGPIDLRFFRWISSYYFYPLGKVIRTALPPGTQAKTFKRLALTPLGETALSQRLLTDPEHKLLHHFSALKSGMSSGGKIFTHPAQSTPLVASLVEKGLLALSQSLGPCTAKPRLETFLRIDEKVLATFGLEDLRALRRKAPRQFSLLKWLRKVGEASPAELTAHLGKAASCRKDLVRKGLLLVSRREVYRTPPVTPQEEAVDSLRLTPEQADALHAIASKIQARTYGAFLLHGVTGSGKTEVYLRAIEAALVAGRSALVLVPEISLTPQLLGRFKARFGDAIAQFHSRLSEGERFDEWRRIRNGEAMIVIGARSAIFAPLPSPGVIVVDEEHDSAYKQEDRLCYHARDLALVKGKLHGAVVILGSATPGIETYYNTRLGKITYLHLSRRVDNRPLPRIEVVDMRAEPPATIISRRLHAAIQTRWEHGEQTMLFLNRRGFSPFVICTECGYAFRCVNCDVSLVYHRSKKTLLCHYCNFAQPAPTLCPSCRGHKLEAFGYGTEKLEAEISRLFPSLKVARLDRDTTARKSALHKILEEFRQGKTELLIGTQMIALGHDLPRVTLVGIIAADLSLNLPDFRAAEKTFQILTQVAGRSGRGQIPGEVIVQTFNPTHPSIRLAVGQSFHTFFEEEISHRQELLYPPFHRMVNFRISGTNAARTRSYAKDLGRLCRGLLARDSAFHKNICILGPAEALWEKLKGTYRWQMVAKGPRHELLHRFTERVLNEVAPGIMVPGIRLMVDVDPVNLL